MGGVILGTGASIPDQVVTDRDLAKIMATSDEWIVSRSGVSERRFAPAGVGSSDLAAEAVTAALADAGPSSADVDVLVAATMTPDRYAPGIAGAVQHRAGPAASVSSTFGPGAPDSCSGSTWPTCS